MVSSEMRERHLIGLKLDNHIPADRRFILCPRKLISLGITILDNYPMLRYVTRHYQK